MSPSSMRRSNRIEDELPITLIGSDTEGRFFLEHTRTILISLHGAGVISQYKLSPEQELVILLENSRKEIAVRVIGQMGARSELYLYGLAFLEPQINFWGREFTCLTESASQTPSLTLECGGCGSTESIEHNDFEIDVYAFNQRVVRYCKECTSSTVWKVSTGQGNNIDKAAQCHASSPASSSAPPATPASIPENKRRHRRTKVDFAACIRRPGLEDDIVVCEDMSRGGVRFKSSRAYFIDTTIQIAVPYSPGASSIFVPAQITHVRELTKRKVFLSGVTFTKFNG